MQRLKNPNIVELLDVKKSSNNIYLIVEYCNGGALDSYLKKNNGKLSESETVNIFK